MFSTWMRVQRERYMYLAAKRDRLLWRRNIPLLRRAFEKADKRLNEQVEEMVDVGKSADRFIRLGTSV